MLRLISLELWLSRLGAKKSQKNPSQWNWQAPTWEAEITLDRDELCVIWKNQAVRSQRCFSYGLSRGDVELAIAEGP